ncbi:tetratricopeptide repeat protein [Zhouia sp. PK063]|uniref:tetratricopeptide repeat protein n=1 Tax=Zhouia sp. PK063 TaxID=3373602 RepID=UPI0037AD4301
MPFSAHEDHNLSIARFESMLKTNDVYFFDAEDFQNIIHYYLDNGKIALAKKAIKIGLDQHPTSTELKLLNIEVLVFENKLNIAEVMLDDLSAIEASNEEIYIQKANIFSKKDNHTEAIKLLKTALTLTDESSDIFSLIGMEYLFLDDYDSAKEYFIKCLEEDAEDYSALYNVIYCFDFLEDHDGAISFLNMFLDANPYCEVAWHQIGKQYFSKKMYKEALSSFEFAIYSDDTFIGAYIEKGKVLEKLGRYNEAIENYEISLKLDDPTSFAYLRIGKCHEKLGNIDLAKKYFNKTIKEDPLLDKGWIAITDFYTRLKDFDKALYYINKAVNIDSENVQYWKRSAIINKNLMLWEEADIAFQKTVELGNYELSTWTEWSDTLLKLGEYDSAILALMQALEFYPEKPELEYRLAGMYFITHESIKASYHLRNALRNDFTKKDIFAHTFSSVYELTEVQNIITEFKH